MFSSSVRSVTTMLALQLPPRLSCSRRVSFESRQGMCALCPALESFSMTEPSEYSERLMLLAWLGFGLGLGSG